MEGNTGLLIIFIAMIGVFLVCSFKFKLPIGLAIVLGAITGTLLGGFGIPIRHLVEGSFTFLDTIIVIISAIIFMESVKESGALETVAREILERYWNRPVILLIALMFVIMFPGMITGSSTASVLTTGALVAPILIGLGIPKLEVASIIAMGGIFGKIAPPINIPVMIMCAAVDMPYMGFTLPLLVVTVPLAIFTVLYYGYKYVKKSDYKVITDAAPESLHKKYGLKLYLPFVFLVVAMVLIRSFPGAIPDPGIPVIMLVSAAIARFTGKPFNVLKASKKAVDDAMLVTGILIGVGIFIQTMALTGVRGLIVVSAFKLPAAAFIAASTLALPAFGAMSSLGAASVFGFPFMIAFTSALASNPIIIASGLSLGAGLGDMVPPTALSGIFAAEVVGLPSYVPILKRTAFVFFLCLVVIALFLIFPNPLGRLLMTQ